MKQEFLYLLVAIAALCGGCATNRGYIEYLRVQADLVYQDRVALDAKPAGASLEVAGPGCVAIQEWHEQVEFWWVPSGNHWIKIEKPTGPLSAWYQVPDNEGVFRLVSGGLKTIEDETVGIPFEGRCRELRAWLRDQGLATDRNGGPR